MKKPPGKPYQELEFTDGFMFKKVLTTRTDYCQELLELILKKKIRRLTIMDYEKTFDEYYESIVIFICRKKISDAFTKPVYTFSYRAEEEPEMELGDGTVTVLVNGRSEDKSIDDEMKDLISLIRSGHTEGKEDSLAARIENLVNEAKRDGRWSAEYMRYKQAERDIARKYIKDEKARADSEKARADSAEERTESAEARLKEKDHLIEELKSQIMKHQ